MDRLCRPKEWFAALLGLMSVQGDTPRNAAPRTSNPPVAGSNPAGRALKNRVLAGKTQYKKWGSRYHWKCFIPTLHQPGLIRDLEPVPCEGLGCWDARGVGNGKTLPGYGRVARASTFRGSRGKGGDVFGAVADE